ncbi:DUF512 domain-containing protein [Paradesulfitobacterium ferrireducens]|uniref:DUF512 domain-containing protein n=1 Tax=Paradesulfitobacterium ferrireducens TaxID=2816476 RepID=UPI001A8E61BB|nr:DUF512 domain-containing protein [Paradesulfitobacterium ferrireducens]
MAKGLVVARVEAGGIAEEMEIAPGDKVLAVSGQELRDIIDFQFLTADEEFTMLIEKPDGEVWEIEIEKDPGEFLGLEVEKVSAGGLKYCTNNCVFCFVAQMPKGMRPSLYDKDDDYRLSLSQGSFVTLSNLSEAEFQRILDLHLSPLYISVHAWNPEARVRLMTNQRAGDVPTQIRRLAEAGILMHTQIVLVPGYNDGEVLRDTVTHLGSFYPQVQSIAVVPVGLTKYRERLTPLRPFTGAEARTLLKEGHMWQDSFARETGRRLVYFADEFYVLAGEELPKAEDYDGFPQLENGVGMGAKFLAELAEGWDQLPAEIPPRMLHLVTGTSAASFFHELKHKLEARVQGLSLIIHSIRNDFFGSTVTVAGLLTAQDIAAQIEDLKGQEFLLPEIMLKRDEDIFLDDRSVGWLEQKINGQAVIVENHGLRFLEALIRSNTGGVKH